MTKACILSQSHSYYRHVVLTNHVWHSSAGSDQVTESPKMTRIRPGLPPPASLLRGSVSRLILAPRRSCSDIEPQVIKTADQVRNRSNPTEKGTDSCLSRYTKVGQRESSGPMECFRSDMQPGACLYAQCCAHIAPGGVSVRGSRPSSSQTSGQSIYAAKRTEYRATLPTWVRP